MHNIKLENGEIVAIGSKESCFDIIREYLGNEFTNAVFEYCEDEIEEYQSIAKVESEERENCECALEYHKFLLQDIKEELDGLIDYIEDGVRLNREKIRSVLFDVSRKINYE